MLRRLRVNKIDGSYLICPDITKFTFNKEWMFLFKKDENGKEYEDGRVVRNRIDSFYWTNELTDFEKKEKEKKEAPKVKKSFWSLS